MTKTTMTSNATTNATTNTTMLDNILATNNAITTIKSVIAYNDDSANQLTKYAISINLTANITNHADYNYSGFVTFSNNSVTFESIDFDVFLKACSQLDCIIYDADIKSAKNTARKNAHKNADLYACFLASAFTLTDNKYTASTNKLFKFADVIDVKSTSFKTIVDTLDDIAKNRQRLQSYSISVNAISTKNDVDANEIALKSQLKTQLINYINDLIVVYNNKTDDKNYHLLQVSRTNRAISTLVRDLCNSVYNYRLGVNKLGNVAKVNKTSVLNAFANFFACEFFKRLTYIQKVNSAKKHAEIMQKLQEKK